MAIGDDRIREDEERPYRPIERFTFAELRQKYPTLNPPVVDGLFRQGETVNIISGSKVGKSWLAYSLSLSIITGRRWLGRFVTTPGSVILIDNELHRGTLAHRIPTVASALGITSQEYEHDLEVWPLRGDLRSLPELLPEFEKIQPGSVQAIIYDAKYRFVAPGKSENDNAAETEVYNLLDRIGGMTGAANVLIHHASKGDQGDKRVTDVGAGAGAQSRAADTHLILREHEEPNVAVLDAALRSFAPIDPLPVRFTFPIWTPADDIDPTKLKGRLTAGERRQSERNLDGIQKILNALKSGPSTERALRPKTGMSRDRQSRLLDLLESENKVGSTEVEVRGNVCKEYSLTVPF